MPADLYFIALLLPPSAARQVERYQVWARDTFESRAALRSPPHVTLQSPFKLADDENKVLKSVLTVCAGPTATIDVTLSGFGAFPPRVVYIDVVRTPELMTVQSVLSRHLKVTFGIGCDLPVDRPFRQDHDPVRDRSGSGTACGSLRISRFRADHSVRASGSASH